MAYNPLTKLLLKFNEGSGSTASADTSNGGRSVTIVDGQVSSANGMFGTNSLEVGDPSGSGVFSYATLSSPAGVWSTSRSSVKRFDCWYYRAANQSSGISPIVSISFANNDTLSVWRGATGIEVEINSQNSTVAAYNYGNYDDYQGMYGWHHLRFVIDGPDFALGIDGTQLIAFSNSTTGEDLWVGDATNPIAEVLFGSWPLFYNAPGAYFRGYLDAIEFTEGDTSWLGGSYTVPTAEPDDYAGGSAPELFGDGANTLDDLTSYGTNSLVEITGSGEATLDDVVSECLGTTLGALSGAGANEVDSVESAGTGSVVSDIVGEGAATLDDCVGSGIGGGKDISTTLMLHFNTGQETVDASVHGNAATGHGTWYSDVGVFNGSALFQSSSGLGGYFTIPPQTALFAHHELDKVVDLYFTPYSTIRYGVLFGIAFGGTDRVTLRVTSQGALYLECTSPGFPYIGTASGVIQQGGRYHIRVAVIGNVWRLCVNGVQIVSVVATPWPTSLFSGVSIAQLSPPATGAGLNGNIDEFRVQEGFFADHGYAGGDFVVPNYEWWPRQSLATGSNAVSVSSEGAALNYAEISGIGSSAMQDAVSYGHAVSGEYLIAAGASTLEDVSSAGYSSLLPVVAVHGAGLVENVTSTGSVGLSWSARGVNTVAVTSTGVCLRDVMGSGAATLQEVSSVGHGPAPMLRVEGAGVNTAAVASTGEASATSSGYGASLVSVVSVGSVLGSSRGYGVSTVSVESIASGFALLNGSGAQTLMPAVSWGSGSLLIQGYGASRVDDICTKREDVWQDEMFIMTFPRAITTRTRAQNYTVRT